MVTNYDDMETNYDDNDLEFGVMPNFIPANAPLVMPEAVEQNQDAYPTAISNFIQKEGGTEEQAREILDGLLARMDKEWDSEPASQEYADVLAAAVEHGFIDGDTAPSEMMGKLVQDFRLRLEQERANEAQAPMESVSEAENAAPQGSVEDPQVEVAGQEAQTAQSQPEELQSTEGTAQPQSAVLPPIEETAQQLLEDGDISPTDDMRAALRAAVEGVQRETQAAKASQDAVNSSEHGAVNPQMEQFMTPGVALGVAPAQQVPQAMRTAPFTSTVSEGQESARSGLHTLADGGLGVIGGLSSLVGVVGRGVGRAARGLAQDLSARSKEATAVAPSVSVLPKISEYRVDQAEKMADSYAASMTQFWQSGRLPEVRRSIEEHARTTGESVPDIMAKMVPGGELEELRTSFVEAVNESPEAQEKKVAMGKALDGWIRQYERGSEEVLSPDSDGSPEHKKLRERFEGTKEKMGELVSESPVFGGDELSHAEKFRLAVQRILEKVQAMVRSIVNLVRGDNAQQEPQPERGYEP